MEELCTAFETRPEKGYPVAQVGRLVQEEGELGAGRGGTHRAGQGEQAEFVAPMDAGEDPLPILEAEDRRAVVMPPAWNFLVRGASDAYEEAGSGRAALARAGRGLRRPSRNGQPGNGPRTSQR